MTGENKQFALRDYQKQAVDSFYAGGSVYGGSGVLVLPCGAGKTVIGLAAAIAVKSEVLVLTSRVPPRVSGSVNFSIKHPSDKSKSVNIQENPSK